MRHFFAFLISLAVHLALLAAGGYAASQGKKKEPSVAIEAVNFDMGMMVAAKVADTTGPQKSEEMKAKTTVASVSDVAEEVVEEEEVEEPVVEEKVEVPEPIVKPKPIIKPVVKPKPKKKVKPKPKPKPKKKKPKKKQVNKKTTKKKVTKKVAKKATKKPIKQQPTTNLSDLFSSASDGGGTQSVNRVKSNGSGSGGSKVRRSSASGGGQGSSNRGSGNANAYGASLRAAISRMANRHYPRTAKRMRKQGTVTVRFNIASNGRISGATVVGSSGNSSLDKGAIKALKRLGKYKPPPPGFGPTVTIPIRFRLNR